MSLLLQGYRKVFTILVFILMNYEAALGFPLPSFRMRNDASSRSASFKQKERLGPKSHVFCSPEDNMQHILGLNDRFSRWRWLQKLLDEETDPSETNKVLFQVLSVYLKFPSEDGEASPELTTSRRTNIQYLLQNARGDIIEAVSEFTELSDSSIYEDLEKILPDPEREEDAFKSLWDIVMELHGRESVKFNEREGREEWRMRCVVARVLLFYDFLSRGIPVVT